MPDQGPSSAAILWKVILATAVVAAVVISFSLKGKPQRAAPPAVDVESLIAPVARFELAAGGGAGGGRDAASIFNNVCGACHTAGVAGAPKKGDKAAWGPRLAAAKGVDGLTKSAIAGKGAMPPKGGKADLTEAEIKAVVAYMTK
jgi:cytochrome c5